MHLTIAEHIVLAEQEVSEEPYEKYISIYSSALQVYEFYCKLHTVTIIISDIVLKFYYF